LGTVTDVNIIEVLPEKCKLSTVKYWYNNGWKEDFSEDATKIKWVIQQVAPAEIGTVSFTCEVK